MASKKEKILESAFELFSEQGFKATTTKEIAAKSGVAEGLIFYYFKDKNVLLKELTRRFSFMGTIIDDIKKLSELDPYTGLLKFGLLYTNFLTVHQSYLKFIWSPEMEQNENVNTEVVQLLASMGESVAVFLGRLVDHSVEQSAIDTAASMFLSSLLTYVIVGGRMQERGPEGAENYIKGVIHIILNGLK